ncbi:aquaporin-like protein [Flammula alnicola]|nr:aquaporin-like protein [Flammula alnicola]
MGSWQSTFRSLTFLFLRRVPGIYEMSAPVVHVRDIQKRLGVFTVWEKKRNSKEVHWAMECLAEAMGVFFYVYFGIGSQVAWIFGNIVKIQGFSSILQVGLAYAFGIVFAVSVCGSTSGGHFNPCVTIAMVIFKGFPKLKAVRYIVAQILGGYLAALVVYTQWKSFLDLAEGALAEAGPGVLEATLFTPNGPAGAFGNYMLAGQTLPHIFMNEFVNCTLIAIIVWACLDPSNALVPPVASTFIIAFAYATAIWGFAIPGLSLNAARDVGARLAAMSIWGTAAGGTSYSAIAALVNIPATLLGVLIYEFFIVDSDRVVSSSHLDFIKQHANHRRVQHQQSNGQRRNSFSDLETSSQEKPSVQTFENAPAHGVSHV